MSTAPVARYRQAIENMDNLKRNTSEAMLKNLSNGRYARKELDKDFE